MTYFDDESLARINAIRDKAAAGDKPDMKIRFPKICNDCYDGLEEPSWILLSKD
jgi:hypothetical protein